MSIKYEFEVIGNLLKVKSSGKDDGLQDVLNYSYAVLQKAIESGSARIFCDERELDYAISVGETYNLAEEASKQAFRLARIAILCNPNFIEEGKFYETVASNRGLVVRVSTDYNELMEWLM
ncbi:MAG: hypothetical protein K9J12_17125 [Melioribacteraceae bacterium]|nr:hypothetical protein [Melioribacteraceae bacterium]MCF8266397.1 hypothetical protein [Melioribacteraceae bacterium]MCF8413242.1 hypothetical protein [Melioribacteraceae bacterium]MCF8432744.1 hypothetical protein [Melioribacteraceae bacterium]